MTYFVNQLLMFLPNVFIKWLDVPIVVSSANMSAQVLVSVRDRSFT